MILGVIISILIPLGFLYIIWGFDIYSLSRVPVMVGAILWGLATFAVALTVQNALLRAGMLDFWQVTLFNAPVLEQALKAVFVIWLASQMRLRSSIDGAVYGFAVGTGFAMAENLLYVSGAPDRALGIALARVLSVSLMHAYTTAIVGTVAGASLYLPRQAHVRRIGLALLFSIMLHGTFNRLVMMIEGVPLISLAIVIGLSGTAFIALLMQRALLWDRVLGRLMARQSALALTTIELRQPAIVQTVKRTTLA